MRSQAKHAGLQTLHTKRSSSRRMAIIEHMGSQADISCINERGISGEPPVSLVKQCLRTVYQMRSLTIHQACSCNSLGLISRLLSATASSPLALTAPDVVLWRKRLKDGNGEGDSVSRLVHHLLGQQPGLRVVDVLVLRVFHPDVPPHAIAMCPVLPLEGGLNA